MTTPSFRFYLHAAAHKEAGADWQEKTLRMLTFDLTQGESPESKEKLIAVARILCNPIFTTEQQREAAFAELFPRGGSRPTYYRFKKRLQDQVGTFDVRAVQTTVWAGYKKTGLVLTEYDEQQARLRRQLEHERHDIEQAGGVVAEDDGDDGAAA